MSDIQHFAELIKDIKFTMFTTIHGDRQVLRSRPMTLQEAEFEGELWFFADKESEMATDIKQNPNVNLGFANPKDHSYVSASGTAELVFDKAKAKELWNPLYKAWFEEGLDDPKLCLIRVNLVDAHYWESHSSPLNKVMMLVKAVTGAGKADQALGKQETIRF